MLQRLNHQEACAFAPITTLSRALSNDRDACSGRSLNPDDKARAAAHPLKGPAFE